MGTAYHVKYLARSTTISPQSLQTAVDERLAAIDRQMSTYRDDSELMQFNRSEAGEWSAVSADVVTVVGEAQRLHRLTDGVQDVSVEPLYRLWQFGRQPAGPLRRTAPTNAEILAARQFVGVDRLEIRRDPPALRKPIAGMRLDLSSLAPGFAVDRIGELLASRGVDDYLVELGGEVRAAGRRPDGRPWRVGVEGPWGDLQPVVRSISLKDAALATSGDYRNVRVFDGRSYAHIIDPRSGQALPMRGFAVTVVAPTCIEADGLATALLVLGPDAGYDWCRSHHVAALFQVRGKSPGEIVDRMSPCWPESAGGTSD
jgi:thiamine biosynthesis lipoprotein